MAVWAFGRLNHLPQLGLMQELANQAMLNSERLTTKVSTLDAVALSQHNAPNLLSAVLLTWAPQRACKLLLHGLRV